MPNGSARPTSAGAKSTPSTTLITFRSIRAIHAAHVTMADRMVEDAAVATPVTPIVTTRMVTMMPAAVMQETAVPTRADMRAIAAAMVVMLAATAETVAVEMVGEAEMVAAVVAVEEGAAAVSPNKMLPQGLARKMLCETFLFLSGTEGCLITM